jgi:hypothetical protein
MSALAGSSSFLVRRSVARLLLVVCACSLFAALNVSGARGDKAFGVETFDNRLVADEAGALATQAASHPYAMTTTIVFNHHTGVHPEELLPDGSPKNIAVNLPAGLVVNPTATETRCREATLENPQTACPNASAVGIVAAYVGLLPRHEQTAGVYNMVTPAGQPAELGFNVTGVGVIIHITGKVRTAGDYGITGEVAEITQAASTYGASLTLWGDPSDPSHDAERGLCAEHGGSCPVERTGTPLLTMPSSCTGAPLATTMSTYSWQEPDNILVPPPSISPPVSGCGRLAFTPSLTVQPTTHAADSPSGLSVEVSVPQEESAAGLAEADLKEAVVTLPAGMSVSPAAANGGLGACTPAEIGLGSASSPSCPESSKVGSVEIETPLLEAPLKGSVYLAQQGSDPFPQEPSNPFGSLIALYMVAEGKGVVIKLPGEVRLDQTTGQLTADFGEDPVVRLGDGSHPWLPQLPFSHLKLEFFGGPRAALVTPSSCGTYTVTSRMTPWSAPQSGPPATPSSSFQIDEGCGGGFDPTFAAGAVNNQAGAFSPFALTGFRSDAEQSTSRIQVSTPPGLAGILAGVPLCEEPLAGAGSCGQGSLIGHVTVGVGAGSDPLYVSGEVFLTGPYRGAPFGLSVVVPAIAGPFNLGTVVVRAAIAVDPQTAALTVTSDPLPQILDGVPLQLRTLHVSIDRERFTFNPTDCRPMSITARLVSAQGASTTLSAPFQAANCATLAFRPRFSVSTSRKTSKGDGASLDAKVTYPTGSLGSEANFARVKVDLPKQLPSRLTTLQKACLAATFEANPASCPAASVIGIVRASTPVLPVPLTGPVYFVSHGGEAFPSLVIVLQGYGVRVDLTAATSISKAGITSSTFKSLPDVPVSSFELYLPEGPYSALTANGDLCSPKRMVIVKKRVRVKRHGHERKVTRRVKKQAATSLTMPTAFVAQNGATIHQNTRIAVTGCPKGDPANKKQSSKRAETASRSVRSHRYKRWRKQ